MPKEKLATKLKRRALGLAFLGVLAGFIAVTILQYNQAFTPVVMVTLKTDHSGNELMQQADVKVRGLIVGEVRSITTSGNPVDAGPDTVTIKIALQPDKVKLIPGNVVAQLLPKTLFGEQYVDLELPQTASGAIRAGDTIEQDRSASAVAVQDVLNDLNPVLEALKPAEVNSTLNAIATALNGRGTELGQNIRTLDTYLQGLNPVTNDLVSDLSKLGNVATEYNNAAPDLLATLNNLQTTSATVVAKSQQLDQLLRIGTSTSNVLNTFLNDDGSRLIAVSTSSTQVLSLLDEYTPEYRCMLAGLAKSEPILENVFRDGRLHISLSVVKQRGAYVPGDTVKNITGIGPQCYGLPNPTQPFQPPPNLNDGAAQVGGASSGAMNDIVRDGFDQQAVGSPAETKMVDTLIADSLNTSPNNVPGVASVLVAPMLRGTVVSAK